MTVEFLCVHRGGNFPGQSTTSFNEPVDTAGTNDLDRMRTYAYRALQDQDGFYSENENLDADFLQRPMKIEHLLNVEGEWFALMVVTKQKIDRKIMKMIEVYEATLAHNESFSFILFTSEDCQTVIETQLGGSIPRVLFSR